jgi:hypothetical protein
MCAFPDHPLLLRGPDVLASLEGRLTAYFVSSRRMTDILADLVLSRMALSPEAHFILVTDDDAALGDDITGLFDEVKVIGPRGDLRSSLSYAGEPGRSGAIDAMRSLHHERFADAWATMTRHWHRRRNTPGSASSTIGLERVGRLPRYMTSDNGELMFVPPDSATWRSQAASLRSATATAVRVDYNINGSAGGITEIAELARDGNIHLARHSGTLYYRSPGKSFDPVKPFRAAAFAGFCHGGSGQNN